MKLLLKLLRVKRTILAIKNDFKEPDSVIDMLLVKLYLEQELSRYEIEVIEMNVLHRICASEIVKLPMAKLMKELRKLQILFRLTVM